MTKGQDMFGRRFTKANVGLVVGLLSGVAVPIGAGVAFADDVSIDTTFGSSGRASMNVSSVGDNTKAIVRQQDGKLVLFGTGDVGGSSHDFAVARFNADGTPDTSFDSDGAKLYGSGLNDEAAYGGTVQSDGKVVIVGRRTVGSQDQVMVVRAHPDGSLDTTFDSDGIRTYAAGTTASLATSVVVQSDGRIVVGGNVNNGSGQYPAVMRFNPDGSLDTSFDSDGVVTTSPSAGSGGFVSVAVQSDGRIVAGGMASWKFLTARFNTDGSPDTSFDSDGLVVTDLGTGIDLGGPAVIQSDGKIVQTGPGSMGGNSVSVVIRMNRDGSLDTGFGTAGIANVAAGMVPFASGVAPLADGRILVLSYTPSGGPYTIILTRLRADGQQDVSFDGDGNALIDVTATSGPIVGMAVLPDGRVAVASNYIGGSAAAMSATMIKVVSSDTTLSSLVTSKGTIATAGTGAAAVYSTTVTNATKSITLTPTVTEQHATVKVNGTAVASGAASSAVALSPGSNAVTVLVTAQNGTTTTYTLSVLRDVATLRKGRTMTSKSVLASVDRTAPRGSTVSMSVKSSTRTKCAVSGTKLKGSKTGTCKVVVSVRSKATKSAPKPRTTRTTVTIRVY